MSSILYKMEIFHPEIFLQNLYNSLVHLYISYNIDSGFERLNTIRGKKSKVYKDSLWENFSIFLTIIKKLFFHERSHSQTSPSLFIKFIISTFEYVIHPTTQKDFISHCRSFNSGNHEDQTRTKNSVLVIRFNRSFSQSS